ncbi:MAG: ribosome biogenesis GTPase YqeH [Aerococcus sp.]|nr:ribosome biogenesis GTPase YqeH [Aerococcus sp.]
MKNGSGNSELNETEAIYCMGCGAEIQTNNPDERGYTPKTAYEKGLANGALYCQRCFKLRHYNQLEKVQTNKEEFMAILNGISDEDALVINVVDVFDIAGSIIPGIQRLTGHNDLVLVTNKIDLLPKALNPNRIKNWLKKFVRQQGIQVKDILLVSGVKNRAVDELFEEIERLRNGRDVYVVGVTNVGKSTLINALIKSRGIQGEWITTSQYPGTTLDIIQIPLTEDQHLIDTPGIIADGQLTAQLDFASLKQVLPKHEVKPRVYQLNPEQTLFVGGVARFDYLSGPKQGITLYMSDALSIHRRKLEGSDAFYQKHVGELLTPPQAGEEQNGFPELVAHSFKVGQPSDIAVSGLGWINLKQPGHVRLWAPKGTDVLMREPLI